MGHRISRPDPDATEEVDIVGFNELLPAAAEANLSLPDDWAQGRAVFGGLAAAVMLRAAHHRVEPERACRSLLTTFAGPLAPAPAEVAASLVRSGTSATFAEGRLVQEGKTRCLLQAAFGADRPSQVEVAAEPRPDAPSPDGLPDMPYVEGLTPAFTQHFAYRWTTGDLPFSASKHARIGGWCRLRDEEIPASAEVVVALTDAWPAPVLPLLDGFAPASSVTWALDLVRIDTSVSASDWWYYQSCAEAAGAGYAHCRAQLWDPNGALAAVSRQTVAVFA